MTCFDEEPDGNIHGECEAEIHHLQSQVEQLQADNARLREILRMVEWLPMEQSKFGYSLYSCHLCGGHGEGYSTLTGHRDGCALDEALASTDSLNWLQEQKAQWRREVLRKRRKFALQNITIE